MADDVSSVKRQAPRGGRIPPHDLQAEESLLGAMMLEAEAIATAAGVLRADDFYKPAHSHIFDAIHALYASGQPVDPVTVADELRRNGLLETVGGHQVLVEIMASTPATTNSAGYARIVEEHALLRRLIGVAGEISEIGYGLPEDVTKALDRAESMVYEVNQRRVTDSTSKIEDLLGLNLDRLEQLYGRGDAITGVPTGYVALDELLSGLQPSNLVIVGGRPAMGKCVAWDTPIVDPRTGDVRTAAELHRAGSVGARGAHHRQPPVPHPRRLAAPRRPRPGSGRGRAGGHPGVRYDRAARRRGGDAGPPRHGAGGGRRGPQAVDRQPRGRCGHRLPRHPLRCAGGRPAAGRRGPDVGHHCRSHPLPARPPARGGGHGRGPPGARRRLPPAARPAGPVPQPGAGRVGER